MKKIIFYLLILVFMISSCSINQTSETSIYFNLYYLPDSGTPYIDPAEPSVNIRSQDLVFVNSTDILFISPKIIPNDPKSDIGDSVISFSSVSVLVYYNKNNSQYYALGDNKLKYEIEKQLIGLNN